jgi:hypothetical protein
MWLKYRKEITKWVFVSAERKVGLKEEIKFEVAYFGRFRKGTTFNARGYIVPKNTSPQKKSQQKIHWDWTAEVNSLSWSHNRRLTLLHERAFTS